MFVLTASAARRSAAAILIAIGVLLTSLVGAPANAVPAAPAASTAPAEAAAFKLKIFRTPSGNIQCAIVRAGGRWSMRCDVFEHDWTAPSQTCTEGDYGSSVGMGGKARPRFICVSDAIDPKGKKLKYGKTLEYGPFLCRSKRSGLKCWNKLGRGWKLSRETYRFFS